MLILDYKHIKYAIKYVTPIKNNINYNIIAI